MISDADEIPNLEKLNLEKVKNKLIFFQQKNVLLQIEFVYRFL